MWCLSVNLATIGLNRPFASNLGGLMRRFGALDMLLGIIQARIAMLWTGPLRDRAPQLPRILFFVVDHRVDWCLASPGVEV